MKKIYTMHIGNPEQGPVAYTECESVKLYRGLDGPLGHIYWCTGIPYLQYRFPRKSLMLALDELWKHIRFTVNGEPWRDRGGASFKTKKVLSAEKIEEMKELFLRGWDVKQIAESLDISPKKVRYHLKPYDKKIWGENALTSPRDIITSEMLVDIRTLYAKGQSYADIARVYGVCRGTIRYHLNKKPEQLKLFTETTARAA